MADSSRAVVRYIEESTWGTTPSSALQTFRATGFRLKRTTQGSVSEELRSDGQIPEWIRTGVMVDGDMSFELSYGTLDDFLEGALRGAWATDTGLSGTESGTDLLANGTTKYSYTIEHEQSDITQFISFTGCRVNSLSLSLTPGSILTGSLGFMGKTNAIAGTTVGTGSATAATTTDPMNAVDHVSALTEGGSSVELVSLELSIANNLRAQPILASLTPDGIGYGRFNVTGTLEAYFADATLLTKYLNNTQSSLRVSLTDTAGNAYVIDLPAIRYTDGETPVDGNDQDVTVRLPFQAILDTTTSKTLRISRNPA